MEIPPNRWDQITQLLLYPMAFSEALEAHEKETGERPQHLWRILVPLTLLGAGCYGLTLGLLVDSWPLTGAFLLLPGALITAWHIFLFLALNGTGGPPRWLRLHFAVVAMLFGDLVFECGIVLNLVFWWTNWLTESQAKGLAVVWSLLASMTMLGVMLTAWRSRGDRCSGLVFLWLIVFQGAVAAFTLALGPFLGIEF